MPLSTNDPNRTTWLDVPKNSDFPIQNIPFGVFLTRDDIITIGTRIGDTAIDLGALHQLGYFMGIDLTELAREVRLATRRPEGVAVLMAADTPERGGVGLRPGDVFREIEGLPLEKDEVQLPVGHEGYASLADLEDLYRTALSLAGQNSLALAQEAGAEQDSDREALPWFAPPDAELVQGLVT